MTASGITEGILFVGHQTQRFTSFMIIAKEFRLKSVG